MGQKHQEKSTLLKVTVKSNVDLSWYTQVTDNERKRCMDDDYLKVFLMIMKLELLTESESPGDPLIP